MGSYIVDFTNTSSEEGTVNPDAGFSYSDKLNEVNEANLVFSGTGELKRSLIEPGSEVKIYRNETLEFHGIVDDIEYYDGGGMNIHASGYERWLGMENGAYASSPWSATASATIFTSLIGESNYLTAGTINAGTAIDFRVSTSDSLWNAMSNLRKKTTQDIQIDYPNSEVDILDHRGSSTSVETLNAGLQIEDVRVTKGYPRGNKVVVYGASEGETRIISNYPTHGKDAASQATYGVITYIIDDRTITTVDEADLLADAEVARLKDPIKNYEFDSLNKNKDWVAGDVLTLNAPSQEVSNEEVRIVEIKRGIQSSEEILEVEVTNKEFAEKTKDVNDVLAEIQKRARDMDTYDTFQNEYSNQSVNTTIAGNVTFYLTEDVIPALTADFNGFTLRGVPYIQGEGSGAGDYIGFNSSIDMRNSQKIVQVPDPSAAQDVATKAYVDGAIGLVWSASGTDFIPLDQNSEYSSYSTTTGNVNTETIFGTAYVCPVHLPDGATITGAVVYGNSATETWALTEGTHQSATTTTMAGANIETEDTSISGNPVDNTNNFYWLKTVVMDQNDKIKGARITYTL